MIRSGVEATPESQGVFDRREILDPAPHGHYPPLPYRFSRLRRRRQPAPRTVVERGVEDEALAVGALPERSLFLERYGLHHVLPLLATARAILGILHHAPR